MLADAKDFAPVVKEEPNQHIFKNIHSCNECRYKTQSIYFIKIHLQRHKQRITPELFSCMDSVPEVYKCLICDYETCYIINLNEHCETRHEPCNEHKREESEKNEFEICTKNKCVETSRRCGKCNFETWSHIMFLKHIVDGCSVNKQFKNDSVKWRQCEQCPYKTKWSSTFKRHVMAKHFRIKKAKHTASDDIKWFQCKHCSYQTKRKSYLQNHILYRHTSSEDIKWFRCQQCLYKAKRKAQLKSHILCRHTPFEDIKWFQCQHCSYRAKYKSLLTVHIKGQHRDTDASEDIKWFKCEHCSYETTNLDNLKQHMLGRYTVGSEDIKWFYCQHCSYRTKNHSLLKRHIVSQHRASKDNQWFQSQHCSFKAKSKSTLKNIQSEHTDIEGIVWFQCRSCSYKAQYKSHLKTHIQNQHRAPVKCFKYEYRAKESANLKKSMVVKILSVKRVNEKP